jgi:indole-3-glycerol phosphate synthase
MILKNILDKTRLDLENSMRCMPLDELKKAAFNQSPPLDLATVLDGGEVKLITEIKRASPSRGIIRNDFNPVKIAGVYAENGAAAISVLTETNISKVALII